jgi:hypothetical protein
MMTCQQQNYRAAVPWLGRSVAGLPLQGARVRSRAGPCDVCGGQSGIGTGFFLRALRFSPVSIITRSGDPSGRAV